jgi:hypothetical protein
MRIFLSYGHDRNTPIARRIKTDLEAAGHSVWIDSSQIKAGDDWRRSITDGVLRSDWTLGLLSRHSVRNPGVCLDELAIALHYKGGAIVTLLVEAEAAVSPPISLSHIQWLDMHDWSERLASNSVEGEEWYRSKLTEILAILGTQAAKQFAGEIHELDRILRPVSQHAEIGALVDGFIGREWLQCRVDQWRRNERNSRLYWISGAPGTGKSSFAAWIAHRADLNVIALNLCRYNIDERKDPAAVLRTIGFQIATRLPDYRRLLVDRFRSQDPDGSNLDNKSAAGIFDWLLVEPLHIAIDGGRSNDRYLIVIDALDETMRSGESKLAEILAESCQKLPAWIAVVATGRPEPAILRQFSGLNSEIIEAESSENMDDLRAYSRRWLASENRSAVDTDARVERMVKASQGNFLYLRMLTDAVTKGMIDLDHPDGLPQGLIGVYERFFKRQFPASEFGSFVPFFEVLVAAEHPVPEKWLDRTLGWSKRDKAEILDKVGSLVENGTRGVSFFHKSLRDWLVDFRSSGPNYAIDPARGAERLMNALWPEFVSWTKEPISQPLDSFCEVELVSQLRGASRSAARLQEFDRLISDTEFVRRRMLVGIAADEQTRREARHHFAEFVSRIVWADRGDPTPSDAAVTLAKVAWQCFHDRAIPPEESILLLVTAVQMATPHVVPAVMDQRLRDFIVRYSFAGGFDDYMGIAGAKGTENMSYLDDAVTTKLSAYGKMPHLAVWAAEWNEIIQEGYRPPWAQNN